MNLTNHSRRKFTHVLLVCGLASTGTLGISQVALPASKGELLYTTHCVTCHTTQMHWREERKASDWDSLKAEVRRWQGNAGLAWSDEDITEVARHLNDTIYKYPQTGNRLSQAGSNHAVR
jgi:hypothetical protein